MAGACSSTPPASRPLLGNSIVQKIAKKHGVWSANILISLQANRPGVAGTFDCPLLPIVRRLDCESTKADAAFHAVLTKSVTPQRVIDNFKLVELDQAEVDELHAISSSHTFRACYPWWTGWGHLGFPDLKESGPPRKA